MVADVLVAPWAEPAPPPYSGRLLTIAEMAAVPDDGWLYELVAGHLVRMPPPQERHGYLESEIGGTLRAHVKPRGLGRVYVGETGFDLTQPGEPVQTVLGADVAFLRAERVPPDDAGDDAYIPGPPDLAVEIASQYRPEMGAKAWLWLQRGARLVWAVWSRRRQVDVWTPGQDAPVTLSVGDVLGGSDVLPGFTYALADQQAWPDAQASGVGFQRQPVQKISGAAGGHIREVPICPIQRQPPIGDDLIPVLHQVGFGHRRDHRQVVAA